MAKIFITIHNQGKNSTYPYRQKLRGMGFDFKKTGRYTGIWRKQVESEEEAQTAKDFAGSHGLACRIERPEERRSSNYRPLFFETHPGLFGSGLYQCVYCGRIKKRDQITVDHLIAVNAIQQDTFSARIYRRLLKRMNITDINDPRNLLPACRSCNSRKGSKGGFWILRGILGRSLILWIFRWLLWTGLFILAGFAAIHFLHG